MRSCSLCKKKYEKGSGTLFRLPKDEEKRNQWSEICGKNFASTSLICADHFLPTSIIRIRNKMLLLPNAEPVVMKYEQVEIPGNDTSTFSDTKSRCLDQSNTNTVDPWVLIESSYNGSTPFYSWKQVSMQKQIEPFKEQTEHYIHIAADQDPQPVIYENRDLFHSNSNAIHPKLEQDTAVEIKSVFSTVSTQTNTRLCGIVQTSDFADEFRFNCFYCSKVFPLQKWKVFINHLKKKHFEIEEAFKIAKYNSLDHDYTPICQPSSAISEAVIEKVVINAESMQPIFLEQLQPTRNSIIESVVLDPAFYYMSDEQEFIDNDSSTMENIVSNLKQEPLTSPLSHYFEKVQNKSSESRNLNNALMNCESKVMSSGVLYLKDSKWQYPKKTALSRCLKRTNMEVMDPMDSRKEKCELSSMENIQQKPTEIAFEYTPRDIVDLLLDSMGKYPVLWQYDCEPFNEDFYEAVEDLCKIINDKWSLNIDNLKMRRSINRILRFYCYLFPNTNVEDIDQFTHYYDKCAVFLPSVNEIAYARCSHCYICYRNDFDLKRHLLEEQKYLQWPYKCLQCKECFRESDEYEFHKRLPHYDEIFRCATCNRTFIRRNIYNKHVARYHPVKRTEYKCDVCDKVYLSRASLRNHKLIHGERKYKCHLCSKSYFENRSLVIHLKKHRKEYDYICEVCGKVFLSQSHLRQHMKKHTGAKVSCNICNLKLRKSSLNRHLRVVHVAYEGTIESTFRAKYYQHSRFVRPRTWTRRLRSKKEANKRKYRCKICEVSFENYKLVVEHNKGVHSDNPKWPCKICSAEFNRKLNLKRHYRKKHNFDAFQVFKLVDQNEDINAVINMEIGNLDNTIGSSIDSKNESIKAPEQQIVKSELLPGNVYFEDEKIHCSTIQDEIMKAADNIATQEIKLEFMNDFFTDLLKENQKNI